MKNLKIIIIFILLFNMNESYSEEGFNKLPFDYTEYLIDDKDYQFGYDRSYIYIYIGKKVKEYKYLLDVFKTKWSDINYICIPLDSSNDKFDIYILSVSFPDEITEVNLVTIDNKNNTIISSQVVGILFFYEDDGLTFDIDEKLNINTYGLTYTCRNYLQNSKIKRGEKLPTSYRLDDNGNIIKIAEK